MNAARILFPAMLMFALGALSLGTYSAGYYWLGTRNNWHASPPGQPPQLLSTTRVYPQQWQSSLYRPAGNLEAWAGGVDVQITWRYAEVCIQIR